jgi:hypothetical protein
MEIKYPKGFEGIDLNNQSVIKGKPREELEALCQKLAVQLIQGVNIVDRLVQTNKWLFGSVQMLAELVIEKQPELENEVAAILEKAKSLANMGKPQT